MFLYPFYFQFFNIWNENFEAASSSLAETHCTLILITFCTWIHLYYLLFHSDIYFSFKHLKLNKRCIFKMHQPMKINSLVMNSPHLLIYKQYHIYFFPKTKYLHSLKQLQHCCVSWGTTEKRQLINLHVWKKCNKYSLSVLIWSKGSSHDWIFGERTRGGTNSPVFVCPSNSYSWGLKKGLRFQAMPWSSVKYLLN